MDTGSVSITGSLHEKNGKWQMVIYGKASVIYPEKDSLTPDRMVRRWISTNLCATKKNFFEANRMLYDKIEEFRTGADSIAISSENYSISDDSELLFTEFISFWIKQRKGTIQQSTWEKYEIIAEKHLITVFFRT